MIPKTKRCSGHKGHWECADEYPDHMVPVTEFSVHTKREDGLQSECRKCRNYSLSSRPRHPDTGQLKMDWLTARAARYYGGTPKDRKSDLHWKACLAKAKEESKAIAWVIPSGPILEHSNVVPFPEKEKTPSLLSVVRDDGLPPGIETDSERKAERSAKRTKYVPQGWLYAMKDHLKHAGILKLGKTNNLRKRLSSANTWGDFEIVYWVRVSNAVEAETMMHSAFFGRNIIREWFRVSTEEVREVMDLCAEEYYWPEEQNNETK